MHARGQQRKASLMGLFYDRRARGALFQVLLMLALCLLAYEVVTNTAANLKKQNIAYGFGFLSRIAGFDISQHLLDYSSKSSYATAFWVGLTNTLLVAALGILVASVLGVAIGLARLSSNWLVARVATVYVEIVRNVPLLLQLLVWYVAVLRALPFPQQAIDLGASTFLDNRGLHLPGPVAGPGLEWVAAALAVGIAAALFLARWARQRHILAGETFPVLWAGAGLTLGVPLLVFLALGQPIGFTPPRLGRFNYEGGLGIEPEFIALLLGLSIYTAAFIAEIVRGGIAAVPRGQTEAASALGLAPGQTMRLVVVPQALRVIIPPLTNQFLNLTKNSSLAVAIGYPDLVSVFAGTVLNQTGQAVEVIVITMAVYLTLSLLTSLAMNLFNARMALVER